MGTAQTACHSDSVGILHDSSQQFLIMPNCRVLNTFKTMILDTGFLEKEDAYILDRMKEMVSGEGVIHLAAAKQLLVLVERAVSYSSSSKFDLLKLLISKTVIPFKRRPRSRWIHSPHLSFPNCRRSISF